MEIRVSRSGGEHAVQGWRGDSAPSGHGGPGSALATLGCFSHPCSSRGFPTTSPSSAAGLGEHASFLPDTGTGTVLEAVRLVRGLSPASPSGMSAAPHLAVAAVGVHCSMALPERSCHRRCSQPPASSCSPGLVGARRPHGSSVGRSLPLLATHPPPQDDWWSSDISCISSLSSLRP